MAWHSNHWAVYAASNRSVKTFPHSWGRNKQLQDLTVQSLSHASHTGTYKIHLQSHTQKNLISAVCLQKRVSPKTKNYKRMENTHTYTHTLNHCCCIYIWVSMPREQRAAGSHWLAIQISTELMDRVKAHLKETGISQRAWIVSIIEKALNETEGI